MGSSLISWVRWIGLSELFPTTPWDPGLSQPIAVRHLQSFAKFVAPWASSPTGNLPPAPAAAPRAQFPVHPRAQGMHGDCTDPLGAGCGRRAGRATPSCRLQPPGTAGLRAVRAAPLAPTPLTPAAASPAGSGGADATLGSFVGLGFRRNQSKNTSGGGSSSSSSSSNTAKNRRTRL